MEQHEEEVAEHKKLLTQIKKRETEQINYCDSLAKMKARGEITPEKYTEYIEEADSELAVIRKESVSLHKGIIDWAKICKEYFYFADNITGAFKNGDTETKKLIFSSLGSNLTLKDKKLNIIWHFPFKEFIEINMLLRAQNGSLEPKSPIETGMVP